MRTISSFMNVTVDGYFEGPNHDISFFKADNQDDDFFNEQAKGESTLLFGHRTYDMMKAYWPTDQAKRENPEMARIMNERAKIVVANRPFEPGWSNVTVISGRDVIDQLRALKEAPGSPIVILGSNALCVALLDADLLDHIQLVVNPVALGDGTPLFKGLDGKAELRLTSSQQLKSGKAIHVYEPEHVAATS